MMEPVTTQLLTCDQCLMTKIERDFSTVLAAAVDGAIICDACLDALPMDLVTALASDPTNDGIPSPNDAPIPLPVEVPGNPSDGQARKALSVSDSQEPATTLVAPDSHIESAGRGIARLMRHDRARFLRCVARVGDSDRHAMADALESYLAAQTHLFTGAPSADRILSFWADEHVALAF